MADLETVLAQHVKPPRLRGKQRATTDETHRVALVHPEYDGFITVELQARTDLGDLRIEVSPELDSVLTAHHKTGPIGAGQVRPADLELHPGSIPSPAVSGTLRIVDDAGADAAPPVRITLGSDRSLDCVLAGRIDGPWTDTVTLDRLVEELLAGRGNAKRLAARIDAVARGAEDPGWSRLPWKRG